VLNHVLVFSEQLIFYNVDSCSRTRQVDKKQLWPTKMRITDLHENHCIMGQQQLMEVPCFVTRGFLHVLSNLQFQEQLFAQLLTWTDC